MNNPEKLARMNNPERLARKNNPEKLKRMNNPEKLATLGTQDMGRRQTKHKYKTQKTFIMYIKYIQNILSTITVIIS